MPDKSSSHSAATRLFKCSGYHQLTYLQFAELSPRERYTNFHSLISTRRKDEQEPAYLRRACRAKKT